MAITYPRQLPFYRFEESTWSLDSGVVESRHAKGRLGTLSRIRQPVWFTRMQTGSLHNSEKRIWQAWYSSLQGINDFYAYDYSRKEMTNYPNGVPQILNATWNGTANVIGLTTANQINLSNVPSGIVFSIGDRIGLVQNSRYGYFEITEDATTTGSGLVNLTVSPRVDTSLFTNAAIAVCYRPLARLRIRSFETSYDSAYSGVSIEAIQVL